MTDDTVPDVGSHRLFAVWENGFPKYKCGRCDTVHRTTDAFRHYPCTDGDRATTHKVYDADANR